MNHKRYPIRIIPLGGFGEIGMNCLAIETHAEILIIDCGVLFPSEPRLGIDTIHADFDYLIQKREKIVGLIATHGHEDHIAAIPFLLEQLDIPIYAGMYTNGLLRERFKEFPHIAGAQLATIRDNSPFTLGQFRITPLCMPHSTLDNFALVIDRPACGEHPTCRLFHTSDFKLNVDHCSEEAEILERLQGIRPVDLMITDSTGSLEDQDAGDEDALINHIGELVESAPGRVFVALFSSNIERICNLIKVAEQTNRKIVLSGRSVINHYQVARETGNIPSSSVVVVPERNAHHLDDNELIVLLSGTQGESRSALGRFAAARHSLFTPAATDTVILSSRFIPGNELQISRTISRLLEQQVTVFHRNNLPHIHVSGHGSGNEILAAMRAVSPKALLPAHGTFEHLRATAVLAEKAKIPSTLIATNGDVVSFTDNTLSTGGKVPYGRVFIENGRRLDEAVVRERNKLANHGSYVIWIWISNEGASPTVFIRQHAQGVIPENDKNRLHTEIEQRIRAVIASETAIPQNEDKLIQAIKVAVRKTIRNEWRRNPIFTIYIDWQ